MWGMEGGVSRRDRHTGKDQEKANTVSKSKLYVYSKNRSHEIEKK